MARFLPSVFLLVLILMATDMGRQFAEGRQCHSQSHNFAGTCFRKVNCHAICQTEGFYGGKCVGFRRRCICHKDC